MSARVYLLLDVAASRPGEVAEILSEQDDVRTIDLLESQPDMLVMIEANDRHSLAELAVRAMGGIEQMVEQVRLLPTRDGMSPALTN